MDPVCLICTIFVGVYNETSVYLRGEQVIMIFDPYLSVSALCLKACTMRLICGSSYRSTGRGGRSKVFPPSLSCLSRPHTKLTSLTEGNPRRGAGGGGVISPIIGSVCN